MTQLVRQHGNNFLVLALLNQRIINNNVLLPRQPEEVGIRMRAPLASIDDVELLQGELELFGQSFNAILQRPSFERGELVEQGQDDDGVDGNHKHLQPGREHPKVKEELASRLLDNLQETGKDGRSEDESEHLGLDQIHDKDLRRLLVETKLFLQHKRVVYAPGQAEQLADGHEGEDEDNGLRDFPLERRGGEFFEKRAGEGPELGEDVELDEGEVLKLRPQSVDEVELGLRAAVGLGLVEDFLGDFLGQDGGRRRVLEDLVLAERQEGFEDKVADGEGYDELLPGEEGAVERAREALKSLLVGFSISHLLPKAADVPEGTPS